MKILITNDDGVESPGLDALCARLSSRHELCVFAPDGQRSGTSHAMTLRHAVKVRKLGAGRYSCSGSPADCVILANLGAIDFAPDAVISGINDSPNLGTDVIYSGTCAGARQGALYNLPSIAVSLAEFSHDFGPAADLFCDSFELLIRHWSSGSFLNVNIPVDVSASAPFVWANPSRRVYSDKLVKFSAPDGFDYCFLAGGVAVAIEERLSDYEIARSGSAAVSAIALEPEHRASAAGHGAEPGRSLA